MIVKPTEQITKADIEALVTEKHAEAKTLEYKMKLPDQTDDAKKEILADETPVKLSSPHRVVVHLIPLGNFLNRERIDLKKAFELRQNFPPIHVGGGNFRFNLDGFINFSFTNELLGECSGYCQVFRDGSIELADASGRLIAGNGANNTVRPEIRSIAFEQEIADAFTQCASGLAQLQVGPPFCTSLSLLGVKGARMLSPVIHPLASALLVDRDNLLLPEIVLEELPANPHVALRPLFDMVWQSCGLPRCYDYDDQGNWKPHQ